MNKEKPEEKWRKSHMSGMTCIRCDKKIGFEDKILHKLFKIKKKDLCKCVSPIKVDMNVVNHHLITEMTYLSQVNKTSGKFGEEKHHLNSLKGYNFRIHSFEDCRSKKENMMEYHRDLHEPQYITESPVILRTHDPVYKEYNSDSKDNKLNTLYFGHPLADDPVSESEIKEYNINLGILDDKKYK